MDARPVGLGCMRLSTDAARGDARGDSRGAAVLDAAIAAGVDLLDTADAYARDEADAGHNERLVGAAVARAAAAGRRVQVATKGGLVRPGGAWVPDGRAGHLAAAARASRERLGVPVIDLYLLHAVDPRTDLATSVRALAQLREDGVARAIGLSNIGVAQLERALAIAPIDAVEVELHPWKLDALRGGLVEACARRGIRVLAHRPLGGPTGARRAAKERALVEIAARHGAAPAEVALAWLRSLSPAIVPLPGATRPETAASAARAAQLVLDDEARAVLGARFLGATGGPPAPRRPGGGEVVIFVGMPASGKSTLAASYTARGYLRLNRDERGGTLRGLAQELDRALAEGAERVVLDNTYGTRAQRAPVVALARRHGLGVRVISMTTPLEAAQANAVDRMLDRCGRLLEPEELRQANKRDPNLFSPNVQFRYRREYEPPHADEGFDAIEEVCAERAPRGDGRALVVELDDLVWAGRPARPESIELRDGAAEALAAWAAAGRSIAGTTWQPGLAAADVPALAARLAALAGAAIELLACAHPAGPPVCWCRKPLPGLALAFARARGVDLSRSLCLGRGPADRGFALRAGIPYADIADGWPRP